DLISIEEVKVALRRVKNGKAAGYDRITPEMMKNMGEKGINVFREICQKAWNSKEIPQDWKMAMIVPAYKNGDKKRCDNYRGINLLCTALKVYEAILESRLKISTEDTLDKAQSGFMRGRSVQDHIFTLKQTIHKMKRSGRKAYFVFIDLVKAFDRVSRSKMWDILKTR
ncbi:reverse transcriptase family protein, partial [Klebsiella pneumoniae]|nr:reverse transcriptase family protein [Klebsiella pneumoniae]